MAGDAKKCVHQYNPPLVGMALPKSAIAKPTTKIRPDAMNHPQTSPTGPAGIEYDSVLAILGSRPMILKAIPKTSIMVKLRRSSCLYPSLARTAASSSLDRFGFTERRLSEFRRSFEI